MMCGTNPFPWRQNTCLCAHTISHTRNLESHEMFTTLLPVAQLQGHLFLLSGYHKHIFCNNYVFVM
jgi:hypothetical protein